VTPDGKGEHVIPEKKTANEKVVRIPHPKKNELKTFGNRQQRGGRAAKIVLGVKMGEERKLRGAKPQ